MKPTKMQLAMVRMLSITTRERMIEDMRNRFANGRLSSADLECLECFIDAVKAIEAEKLPLGIPQ